MHPATVIGLNDELIKIAKQEKSNDSMAKSVGTYGAAGALAGGAIGAAGGRSKGANEGAEKGRELIRKFRSIKRDEKNPFFEFKHGTKDQIHAFDNRHNALKRPKNRLKRQEFLDNIVRKHAVEGGSAGMKKAWKPAAAVGLAGGALAGYMLHKQKKNREK